MTFGALTHMHGEKNKLQHSIERVYILAERWGGYMHVDIDDYMRLFEDK